MLRSHSAISLADIPSESVKESSEVVENKGLGEVDRLGRESASLARFLCVALGDMRYV